MHFRPKLFALLALLTVSCCEADWDDGDDNPEEDEQYWDEHRTQEKVLVCGKMNKHCHCDKGDNITLNCANSNLESANLHVDSAVGPVAIANLKGNQITYLFKGKVLPSQEASIMVLDLSANKIEDIEPGTFDSFKQLLKLKLTHNSISELSQDIFTESLSLLNQLYLDYNFLEELDNGLFDNLKSLTKLSLDGNSQLKISNKVLTSALANLQVLSLDRCHLDTIDEDLFVNLPNLRALSLSGNPLASIPEAINPTQLPMLTALAMSDTNLKVLKDGDLQNSIPMITRLYMSRMPSLRKIDKCAFCGLSNLKTVDLHNSSKLNEFDKDAFGVPYPKELKQLNLANCSLSTLNEGILPKIFWNTLQRLELAGNQWNCDCNLKWLIDNDQAMRTVFQFDKPTCQSPEELKGKMLFEARKGVECGPPKEGTSSTGKFVIFLVFMVLVSSLLVFGIIYARKRYVMASYGEGGNFRIPRLFGGSSHGVPSNQMGFSGRNIFDDNDEEEAEETVEANVPSARGQPRPEFV